MLGVDVQKSGEKLEITWQLSKTEILLSDILDVYMDDTYAGNEKEAVRIGTPFATTDRVAIKTRSKIYILFTTNGNNLLDTIKTCL